MNRGGFGTLGSSTSSGNTNSNSSSSSSGGGAPAPGVSRSSRFRETLRSVPYVTRLVMAVCWVMYIASLLWPELMYTCMIMPSRVVLFHEYERLLYSAYMHGGFLHILFNMMSFFYLGPRLELKFGSLPMFGLVSMFTILANVLYVFVGWYGLLLTELSIFDQGAIGFSAVIFSLIVVDVMEDPSGRRSVFGFCAVPAWVYPWVLLVLFSVMMSNVSFLGHLSGLLIGYLYSKGLLDWCAIPRNLLISLEDTQWMNWLVSQDTFARCARTPVFDRPASPCLHVCTSLCSFTRRFRCSSLSGCCNWAGRAWGSFQTRQEERQLRSRQRRYEYEPVGAAEHSDSLGPHDDVNEHQLDVEPIGMHDAPLERAQLPLGPQLTQSRQLQGNDHAADPKRLRAHHHSRLLDRIEQQQKQRRPERVGFGLNDLPVAALSASDGRASSAPAISLNPHYVLNDTEQQQPQLSQPQVPPQLPQELQSMPYDDDECDADLQAALETSLRESEQGGASSMN